jgi:hypothetical protein
MKKSYSGILCVAATIVVLAVALPVRAVLVSYTVDGWGAQNFPGTAADTPAPAPPNVPAGDYPSGNYWGPDGYPGDQVAVQSYTGTLNLTPGTTIQQINVLNWTGYYTYAGDGNPSDPNEGWQQLYFNFGTPRSLTIDGQTAPLSQGGLLQCLWDNDYLSVSDGSTVSLYVDGYRVDVTPLGLPAAGAGWSGSIPDGVPQPDRNIMAQFVVTAVPEPTTGLAGALLLLPFGASTLRILRRNRAS